jgi:predicted Rossmann-fold nucleotide-binding protein
MGVADDIRGRCAPGGTSLAIPSWVTAGEPISQFASHIAKYFSNSIREAGMLAVATAGIVFAPGGAGTMQEIFQDAAQNASGVFDRRAMAFLDARHYRLETGLYPALERQGARLGFADLLSLGDEPDEILDRFPAVTRRPSGGAMSPEMLVRRMRNGG